MHCNQPACRPLVISPCRWRIIFRDIDPTILADKAIDVALGTIQSK